MQKENEMKVVPKNLFVKRLIAAGLLLAVMVSPAFAGEVILDLKELSDFDIGIEMLFYDGTDDSSKLFLKEEMQLTKKAGTLAYYRVKVQTMHPGTFNFCMRIFPKNEHLPHRQDFSYLTWI